MATVDDIVNYIKIQNLGKSAKIQQLADSINRLRNQGGGSQTSGPVGNSGGGGGGAPVSTLAGLPQTPELKALMDKGLIREGMDPNTALAIMAASAQATQVPIDIAALKKMIMEDYTNSLQGVTGPAADWMQQTMGTMFPGMTPMPGWDFRGGHWYDENGQDMGTTQGGQEDGTFISNDPNAQMYMRDPVFSDYAGGLQQMQQTAEENRSTDLAWFDKQQQAMTDYYNGLMAQISAGGGVTGGGGSGGGGGGGRRRGGGGGGGGGGDNPYGFSDPTTTATSTETATDTATSTTSENWPKFWQDALNNVAAEMNQPVDQFGRPMGTGDQQTAWEHANDILDLVGTGNPADVLSSATTNLRDLQGQDEIEAEKLAGNDVWTSKQPEVIRNMLNDYMTRSGMVLGDNPATPELEWQYRPEGNTQQMDEYSQQQIAMEQPILQQIFDYASAAPGYDMISRRPFNFTPQGASNVARLLSGLRETQQNFQAPEAPVGGIAGLIQKITGALGQLGDLPDNGGGNGGGGNGNPGTPVTPAPATGTTAIDNLIASQIPGGTTTTPTVNNPPAQTTANINGTIASQMPPTTVGENQIIYDANLPVANVDPVTGQPPADESNGMVYGPGGLPMTAGAAAEELGPTFGQQQGKNWMQNMGWHLPASLQSIIPPGPQSTAERAATNATGGFVPPNPSEIVSTSETAGMDIPREIFQAAAEAAGGPPSIAQINHELLQAGLPLLDSNGQSTTSTSSLHGFGKGVLPSSIDPYTMPQTAGAGDMSAINFPQEGTLAGLQTRGQLPMGANDNDPTKTGPPMSPEQLQRLAQSVLGIGRGVRNALVGDPNNYPGRSQAIQDAFMQQWMANMQNEDTPQTVTPSALLQWWQARQFNPSQVDTVAGNKPGGIAPSVMSMLQSNSAQNFQNQVIAGGGQMPETLLPGSIWQQPEDAQDAHDRMIQEQMDAVLQQIARERNPGYAANAYRNQFVSSAKDQSVLSAKARSTMPEAAALTGIDLANPDVVPDATDDSTDYINNAIQGFRTPGSTLTNPSAQEMDRINRFVPLAQRSMKRSAGNQKPASSKLALIGAAVKRLQGANAAGGYKKSYGKF